MIDDLVLNSTIDFIAADRDRLDLAFAVEDAAGELRVRATNNVLEKAKSRLSERGWLASVQYKQHSAQAVCLLKESWREHCKRNDSWQGVRLVANNGTGWQRANVSVAPFVDVDPNVLREKMGSLSHCELGPLMKLGNFLYWELRGELADWNVAAFVLRGHNEPDSTADLLVEAVEEAARAVDKVLGTAAAD